MWQIISSFYNFVTNSTKLDLTIEIGTEKSQIEIDFEHLFSFFLLKDC